MLLRAAGGKTERVCARRRCVLVVCERRKVERCDVCTAKISTQLTLPASQHQHPPRRLSACSLFCPGARTCPPHTLTETIHHSPNPQYLIIPTRPCNRSAYFPACRPWIPRLKPPPPAPSPPPFRPPPPPPPRRPPLLSSGWACCLSGWVSRRIIRCSPPR